MRLTVLAFIFSGLMVAPLLAQEPVPVSKLPFSSARKAGGTLYISGNIGRSKDLKKLPTVTEETHAVMKNLERTLKENGYTFDDVVKATVYLNDLGDYAEMNKAYATYFKDKFPARECVGGVDIVFSLRVEISMIAYKAP